MDIRYPIGKPDLPNSLEEVDVESWLKDLDSAAPVLREVVAGLSDKQLDTPYRDGGWTPRQIVHHLADSHMNAYLNFRLALAEDTPLLRSSNVDAWGNLLDSKIGDIRVSLDLFEALQARWVMLLRGLQLSDYERKVQSATGDERSLWMLFGVYAWHGKHHIAQIRALRNKEGW